MIKLVGRLILNLDVESIHLYVLKHKFGWWDKHYKLISYLECVGKILKYMMYGLGSFKVIKETQL